MHDRLKNTFTFYTMYPLSFVRLGAPLALWVLKNIGKRLARPAPPYFFKHLHWVLYICT